MHDSDNGDMQEGDSASGKPGRKKNPNSQAARRDQNRIAQREFRLRKQQRIRDLEARVEILSGGKDEALSEMRNILKDLMAENHVLRGLLRSLSEFIGDGAGGLLPKLGWTMRDFDNYVNRSETDTAYESFQRRKQESGASGSRKRAADGDAGEGRAKRAREDTDRASDAFPVLAPMNPVSSGGVYPTARSPQDNSLFADIMRPNNGSTMFVPGSSNAGSPPFSAGPQAPTTGGYPPYLGSMGMGVDASVNGMNFAGGSGSVQLPPMDENELERPDPKSEEAQKLISYHLDNYKRNSQYCLPASLRPTLVQRTVPHESVIDRIPHPDLRDRLILLRGRFNLVDCLHDYAMSVTIHGDDVLAHNNWEINETWLKRYGFLIDQGTLNISNKWRRERGLAELRLSDIAPSDSQPQAPL
ncbi:hypothetical protein OF83DRAFT_357826 [Amylostereum chailletii]|nr:hypothetical protein OF83DRAFT_357826 [Amylostereum chailletii]